MRTLDVPDGNGTGSACEAGKGNYFTALECQASPRRRFYNVAQKNAGAAHVQCTTIGFAGKRSAKAKPSRWTTSPTVTGMGVRNIGPAETKV